MRPPLTQRNPPRASAFTLVALLVALSVMVLLLVMVTQLVNSASLVATQSGKHIDADTQARMLFDRMALDFSNMIKRPDVDTLFYKATGNDKIFFFSQVPAYYDSNLSSSVKSGVSLVGYRVTDNTGDASNFAPAYSLERLGKGLTWDNSTPPGSVVFTSGTATPTNTLASTWTDIGSTAPYAGNSAFYHILAEMVLRMEICFQVKDLTNPGAPSAAYSNYPVAVSAGTTITSGPPSGGSVGDRWYDTAANRSYICTSVTGGPAVWQPNGLKDVLSIVATIAILDSTSRKIVPDMTPAAGLFLDPQEITDLRASPPNLPLQIWNTALATELKTHSQGIPKAAVAQIRIYQRHFFLNSSSTQ